jgi:hypothetical protein
VSGGTPGIRTTGQRDHSKAGGDELRTGETGTRRYGEKETRGHGEPRAEGRETKEQGKPENRRTEKTESRGGSNACVLPVRVLAYV